jgi:hypothetical protein
MGRSQSRESVEISIPLNQISDKMVKAIEQGAREFAPANVDELYKGAM